MVAYDITLYRPSIIFLSFVYGIYKKLIKLALILYNTIMMLELLSFNIIWSVVQYNYASGIGRVRLGDLSCHHHSLTESHTTLCRLLVIFILFFFFNIIYVFFIYLLYFL